MLYIVRHGQTAKNKQKVMQGRSNVPLNDEGRAQAAKAGERLSAIGAVPAHVYSSPLIRAVETAEIIVDTIRPVSVSSDDSGSMQRRAKIQDSESAAACHEVQTDDRLIEMDYGPYEGMDLMNPAPEVIEFFKDFAGTPAPEGMEQLSSVVARAGEFLEEIREEAQEGDVIISTHAILMKGILEYLTPDSNGAYWSKYIGNCEIYAAEAEDGQYGIPCPLPDQNIEQLLGV